MNENVMSYIHLFPTALEANERLQPGHLAILPNARWEEVDKLNKTLGILSGKDVFSNVNEVAAYVVYKDTEDIPHQMYSFVPFCFEEADGAENVLPEYITKWVAEAENRIKAILAKRANGANDVEQLVFMQCKSFTFHHDKLNYYDSDKTPSNTNTYTSTYMFYPVHSVDTGEDYYYVAHEGMYSFSNQLAATYHKSVGGALSKIQEYYGGTVEENCFPDGTIKSLVHHLHNCSPNTTEATGSITTGLSWNLGGSVTFSQKNGTSGGVTSGVSVSNSRTQSVSDVTVHNYCNDDPSCCNAKWTFSFRPADSNFNFFSYGQVDLIDCAEVAKSTFVSFSEWIWHFDVDTDRSSTAKFNLTGSVKLKSSRARLTAPFKTGCAEKTSELTFNLSIDINKPPCETK